MRIIEKAEVASPYEQLLAKILEEGHDHGDRTGTGRRSIVAPQLRYDMSDGTVPLVTTRQIPYKSSIRELVWFIRGSNNAQELRDMGAKFWDLWAVTPKHISDFQDKFFDNEEFLAAMGNETFESVKARIQPIMEQRFIDSIGPMYGAAWRNAPRKEAFNSLWPNIPMDELPSDKLAIWKQEYEANEALFSANNYSLEQHCSRKYYETVDQLNELVRNLKKRPFSSRLVLSAWIPEYVPFEELSPQENVMMGRGSLAACHCKFQLVVTPGAEGEKHILNMIVDIRSSDGPVGLPHNQFQYAVLQHALAHVVGMSVGELVVNLGDSHIYLNQIEKAEEQVKREAKPFPSIIINPELKDIFQMTPDDVVIANYLHGEPIAYEVSV